MKKLFPYLLLLPLPLFSFEIGTNFVEVKVGSQKISGIVNGTSGSMDGIYYAVGGTYNLPIKNSGYGVDASAFYAKGEVDSNSFEVDGEAYTIALRPFLSLTSKEMQKDSLYADLVYQWTESETKIKSTSVKTKGKADSFTPGFGVQSRRGNFIIDPNYHYVSDGGLDGHAYSLELSYVINSNFTAGIDLDIVDYEQNNVGSIVYEEQTTVAFALAYTF
jgi:hypothetical protein